MKRDEVSSTGATSGEEATPPRNSAESQEKSAPGERLSGLRRVALSAASSVSRPKMRADLRSVHEGPGPGDGQRLPGLLRIIDLRNDRKFDFTAQEHFLCREANGLSTPDDLQKRLQVITDAPLTALQVQKFFRRLNILGLLEPEEPGPAATAAPTPRLRPRAARTPAGFQGGPAAPQVAALDLARPDPAKSEAARPGPAKPDGAKPEATTSEPAAAETVTPVSGAAGPMTLPATKLVPPATTRRFGARPAPANFDPLDEDNDLPDIFGENDGMGGPESDGRFGGRMRLGMGGMGGGMGGGFGGGGVGGGGGMMGMGPLGAMGGGMMGMRDRQSADAPEKELGPTQFPLFNPDLLLRALYFTFWPLKYFLWMMPPISIFAGLTLIQKMPEIGTDLATLAGSSDLLMLLLLGLIVVSLGSRIAQGIAITAQGGRVRSLGINLMMGFLPRFYIDESAIKTLDRRGQMWAHGAPLLYRLSMFAFGILIWAATRETGGSAPVVALTLAKFGLILFTLTAWPLIPADGMRFMGAALGQPKLLGKSLVAAKALLFKGRLPPMIQREEAWPLALYAVGTVVTSALVLGVTAVLVLIVLESRLGGLGVILFLSLMTVATLWFVATFRLHKRNRAAAGFGGMGAARGTVGPAMAAGAGARAFRGLAPPQVEGDRAPLRPGQPQAAATARAMAKTDVEKMPNRARVVWSLILCALLVAAFLPYTYEAGGQVEILPSARGNAVARTDGEIVEVLVAQGDRVTRGTPLVRLSDWDQLSNISVTEAKLSGARATLAKLEAGAQAEEIAVARAKLAHSEAIARYKQAEVERARNLVASGTVSPEAAEKAEADFATAVADVEADKANLDLALAGATAEELEIARSDVSRLERELAFDRDELQRTVILAPVDGTVVTGDLHLRVGDYLKTGDEFLEIEQTDVVTATISVPEADIGFIKPGQTVRLRAQSQSEIEVTGEILQVAPVAEDAGYGRIVRATAVFPNDDGLLRSSMTGWAKIEGDDMLAWQAYLRTIVRFVQIDVWSWIP